MKILLFVSSHCPHCPDAERIVRKIVPEYGLSFSKIRMKTPKGKELSSKYNIMALPTLLILDNNENEVKRIVGVPDEDLLKNKIEKLLGLRKSFLGRIFGR